MTILRGSIRNPAGQPALDTTLQIDLLISTSDLQGIGFVQSGEYETVGVTRVQPNDQGDWQVDLTPNSQLVGQTTVYRVGYFRGGTEPVMVFVSMPDDQLDHWIGELATGRPSEPPSAPTNFRVTSNGNHTATLEWNPNGEDDLHHYELLVRDQTSFQPWPSEPSATIDAGTEIYVLNWLTNDHVWGVQLTAVNTRGQKSSPVEAKARPVSPEVPDTVAPAAPLWQGAGIAAIPGQVELDWLEGPEDDIDVIQIWRQSTGNWVDGVMIAELSQTPTKYVDTAVSDDGTTYNYRLRFIDLSGNASSYSSVKSATPEAEVDAGFTEYLVPTVLGPTELDVIDPSGTNDSSLGFLRWLVTIPHGTSTNETRIIFEEGGEWIMDRDNDINNRQWTSFRSENPANPSVIKQVDGLPYEVWAGGVRGVWNDTILRWEFDGETPTAAMKPFEVRFSPTGEVSLTSDKISDLEPPAAFGGLPPHNYQPDGPPNNEGKTNCAVCGERNDFVKKYMSESRLNNRMANKNFGRTLFRVQGGHHVGFVDIEMDGANHPFGPAKLNIIPNFPKADEAQALIQFIGVENGGIVRCDLHHANGDVLAMRDKCRKIYVGHNRLHHAGRQIITPASVFEWIVEDNDIEITFHNKFDLEPPSISRHEDAIYTVDDGHIIDNRMGAGRGIAVHGHIGHLAIRRNTSIAADVTAGNIEDVGSIFNVQITHESGILDPVPGYYIFEDNNTDHQNNSSYTLRFKNVTHVYVHDNRHRIIGGTDFCGGTGTTIRSPGVFIDSRVTCYRVENNNWGTRTLPPGIGEVTAQYWDCGSSQPVPNVWVPPGNAADPDRWWRGNGPEPSMYWRTAA